MTECFISEENNLTISCKKKTSCKLELLSYYKFYTILSSKIYVKIPGSFKLYKQNNIWYIQFESPQYTKTAEKQKQFFVYQYINYVHSMLFPYLQFYPDACVLNFLPLLKIQRRVQTKIIKIYLTLLYRQILS